MSIESSSQVTRRNFLIASSGLLIPRPRWISDTRQPVLHWPLEGPLQPGRESVTGLMATIVDTTGRLCWVNEATTQLLRLDGYSVWIEHHLEVSIELGRALTLSAWIALESFPVETASVIEWGNVDSGVSLAIDRLGYVLLTLRQESIKMECRSERPIEQARWIHLGCTSLKAGKFALFIDGEQIVSMQTGGSVERLSPIQDVYLGRAMKDQTVAKIFRTNVLNGFLRQVRVYNSSFSPKEIRMLGREFQWHQAPLATDSSWFATDAQRPGYHAMPPRAWTNEPHGLVHWHGQYHLFYQKNPNGPYWGHIHWGHMTSANLLQWTEQAVALTPSRGPDSEGCWSGSVIVANNKLVILYTGGDGNRASICMASSEDGFNFTKHPGNPVIEAPPTSIAVKEFRDPFVWREGTEYRMIIGSGVVDVGGTALIYRSSDLIAWHYIGPLLIGYKQSSGTFWEMPTLLKVGKHHVLTVCEVPGRASYWVGTWEDDAFRPFQQEPQRLDLFNHFLSPTPCTDERGRVITVGIAPETRAPIEQWQAGWAHLYGLPREWTLDDKHRLRQTPIRELSARFVPLLVRSERQPISANWNTFESMGTCINVQARFERGSSEAVLLSLRRSPDRLEETLIRYDWLNEQLIFDRSKSSLNTHVARDTKQIPYKCPNPGVIGFNIFLDQSIVEVFVDDQACFTSRIYPSLSESVGCATCSEGGEAYLTSLFVSQWKNL